MPGPCFVFLRLAVYLAKSKATKSGECSGGPSDGLVLPGPGDLCPSLLGEPVRAHQSWSVICYSVVLLVIKAGVAGQCSKPLGKQWPVLISPSCLQADTGTLAPLGMIHVCLPRLVPYPQHTDPAWPDTLLVSVLMKEALQAVGWGMP